VLRRAQTVRVFSRGWRLLLLLLVGVLSNPNENVEKSYLRDFASFPLQYLHLIVLVTWVQR